MSPIEIAIVSALDELVAEGAAFAPVADLNFAPDGGFVEHLSFPPNSNEAVDELIADGHFEATDEVEVVSDGGAVEPQDMDEPAAKLGFTFLRMPDVPGKHKSYEIHATGCRDLRHQAIESNSWSVMAEDGPTALADELAHYAEADEVIVAKDYKVMPCCNLKRMRAAGRA